MPNNNFIKAALWTSSARWIIKIIGIFSSAILVRMLAPEDFGIVAKALLILGLFEIFIEIKFSEPLIKIQNPTKDDYDTAFTLNILLGILCLIFTNILAYFSNYIFFEPQLPYLISLLSIRIIFYAIESPYLSDYLRNLEYNKDFYYLISQKLLSVTIAVSVAIITKNYYALLIGNIANIACGTIISYIVKPYRPKLSLKKYKYFLSYGMHNFYSNFANSVFVNLDRFILAKYVSAYLLGIYNLAYELAFQLTNEVIYPLSRAFFPIFSKLEQDSIAVKQNYQMIMQFIIIFSTAIACGLYLLADGFILLYAGKSWSDSIIFFKLFAIAGSAQTFCMINYSIFAATGNIKLKSKLLISQIIITILCMLPFVFQLNLYNIAFVKTMISVIYAVITIIIAIIYYRLNIIDLLKSVFRISISICSMIITSYFIKTWLLLDIIIYAMVFVMVNMVLWYFMGRAKNDIEYYIYNYMRKKC